MNDMDFYAEYCTGCGLCHSICGTHFKSDEKGFPVPCLQKEDLDTLNLICPASGYASNLMDTSAWGHYELAATGWASEKEIRQKASSGGVLTALCIYLLEHKKIDGIIQTKAANPAYCTKTVVSRTPKEVLECTGSRYSISSPLSDIKSLINPHEHYAFVGKPCDVSALKMAMDQDKALKKSITYLFSFFCAGVPSKAAQETLLKQLGCTESNQCVELQYRGNGWPGLTSATKTNGDKSVMIYQDSWGKILGRDVRKMCRVCIDGVGEFADIVCGDAWYLTKDGKPDFNENDGRNVIFARTRGGVELLQEAFDAGCIQMREYSNVVEELKLTQTFQFERRATMDAMLGAYKIAGKKFPHYNMQLLRKLKKACPFSRRVRRFLGTFKRIAEGKI